MEHRRDAERIVKNLDGEKMAGEKVDIQHAKGKSLFRTTARGSNFRIIVYPKM